MCKYVATEVGGRGGEALEKLSTCGDGGECKCLSTGGGAGMEEGRGG